MPGTKIIKPALGPVLGSIAPPGDKSISHRALIIGTLAEGVLRVSNLPGGRDVQSTRRCLERLGADIRPVGPDLIVKGLGLDGLKRPVGDLDCGNSGTTMRLLMGVLSGQPFESRFTGDASLSRRPMGRVADPLSSMGADFDFDSGRHAPFRLKGRRPLDPIEAVLEVPSAQVKSAILLAGLFAVGTTTVEDPFGTRDHTERMLAFFGEGEGAFRVSGKTASSRRARLITDRSLTVAGDPSSAAYFAAAAALVPGSEVNLRGILLNPTRLGFFDALAEMGARVETARTGTSGGEPVGDMRVRHAPLKPLDLPAERVPALIDEIPLLAVVAAAAEGSTRLRGLNELRVKESDRVAGTAAGLAALGAEARVDGDDLVIVGGKALSGAAVETLGDHRLAMAFAVAGLAAKGTTTLSDAECAAISYPGFFDDMEGLLR